MRKHRYTEDEAGINITPLLDIVFIVLIFFVATNSFLREPLPEDTTVAVESTPQAQPAIDPIVVIIDAGGSISLDGRSVDRRMIPVSLAQLREENPERAMTVTAHPEAGSLALVTVLDAARAVGIESISVSSGEEP